MLSNSSLVFLIYSNPSPFALLFIRKHTSENKNNKNKSRTKQTEKIIKYTRNTQVVAHIFAHTEISWKPKIRNHKICTKHLYGLKRLPWQDIIRQNSENHHRVSFILSIYCWVSRHTPKSDLYNSDIPLKKINFHLLVIVNWR